MKKIKSLFFTVISLFAMQSMFAISGVEQKVQDASGQFVYYKDNSFKRESYIGIIYYDDATYGFRYFAPQTQTNPQIDMQLYISIDSDPNRTNVEFTGEKIEPYPYTNEETDIVNYIHDFVYEMFPRRKNVGLIEESKVVNEDYAQFGGIVSIEYDSAIPILNLKRITTSDGKIMLDAVTGGRLISSTDTSFLTFKGFPSKLPTSNSKVKKGKIKQIEVENENMKTQIFDLDTNWEQKSAVSWMYKSDAAISTVAIPMDDSQKIHLLRTLILGRDHSYSDWTKLLIKDEGNSIKINQIFYDSQSNSFKKDFKRIETIGENTKSIFTLTTDLGIYTKNKAYFEKILESYKLN